MILNIPTTMDVYVDKTTCSTCNHYDIKTKALKKIAFGLFEEPINEAYCRTLKRFLTNEEMLAPPCLLEKWEYSTYFETEVTITKADIDKYAEKPADSLTKGKKEGEVKQP